MFNLKVGGLKFLNYDSHVECGDDFHVKKIVPINVAILFVLMIVFPIYLMRKISK